MNLKYRVSLLILLAAACLTLPYGALGAPPVPEKAEASQENTLDLSSLAISESLGKVETRSPGKSSRWVVHIQDVHAHFAAQENIAAILDQLNAAYGIKTVAVEGSWHSTSLPKSWALPGSSEKQMLARALLEDHYLTGPGYAALFSKMPMTLIGIEDGKLYEENRKIYLQHISKREKILKQIAASDQETDRLKEKIFSPDFRIFDQALSEFRKGKKAEKFLPALISKTEALGVDLSPFDQIVLLKNALSGEKSLNKEKLKAEGNRLVQAYKSKRLSFEELLRSGKVSAEKLQFYPELQKYLKLMKIQDHILHRALFAQLDEVIGRVKEKLVTKEEEKNLDQRAGRFELAKKIILFQAAPDDLKIYQTEAEALNRDIQKEGLGEALNLGLRFYEIAKKRDAVFFEKIMSNPKLSQNIAVVTGGFHTEGLSERLEKAGISYLVITPDLAGEAPNEAVYFEKLKIGPVDAHALAFPLNYVADRFDDRLPLAVLEFKRNKNLTEAKKVAAGTGLPQKFIPAPASETPGSADLNFENLSQEEQRGVFRDLVKLQEGKRRVVYLIKENDLTEIFKNNPFARILWTREIFSKKENTVVLLGGTSENIPDEILGVSAAIKRVPGENLEATAAREAKNNLVAVLGPEYPELKRNGNILFIPTIRIAGVMLARPILESTDPRFSSLNAFTSEMLNRLENWLRESYLRQGLLKKAA